jgi:hypothetical protein
MTIEQTVMIPADHRLIIDVPREVPAGPVIITFTPAAEAAGGAAGDGLDFEGECPLCAKYRNPETGELRPNAETAAAIREGRAMMRGEIPAKRFHSLDEMWEDLMRDDAD